jgi:DNA-binding transcriptional LysR family regulator
MNVSLPQLKAFAAVARQKSFTRAAAELGLTQSAISRSVRELEEEIDQRLFDRTTRQVELTDAGEMLSQRICHLVEEVEQTLRDSHGTGKPCEGTVQIATDPVLSSMTLPMWVAGCRKAWPGIGITLRDCSHECVLQRVRSVDPFQAVLPAGHPLAARESLGWGELGDASVLTLDQSSGIQPAVERALAAYRVRPGSLQVLGHFAAVFGMVAMGLGIGVVPSRAQAAGIAPSAVLRPLRPQVTSNVMLVRRKARSLKPNAAAVWDNLRAQEYERGDYANQGLLKKVG